MVTLDRLDELETLAPPDEWPADARLPPALTVGDLRDLLALVPVVRAAFDWDDQYINRWHDEVDIVPLQSAIHNVKGAP